MCAFLCVFVVGLHISAIACRGRKRVSDALEFDLLVLVSCLMWVLRNQLRSLKEQQAGTIVKPPLKSPIVDI